MGEVRKLGEKLGVDKSCAACSSCDFRCADDAGRLDRLSKPCGGFSPMSESSGLSSFLRVEIYKWALLISRKVHFDVKP